MRVEEQLASLEQYLGRTEEGFKSLAYFQLKALWRVASKRLEQFGKSIDDGTGDAYRFLDIFSIYDSVSYNLYPSFLRLGLNGAEIRLFKDLADRTGRPVGSFAFICLLERRTGWSN